MDLSHLCGFPRSQRYVGFTWSDRV